MDPLDPELKAMGSQLAAALLTGTDSEVELLTSELENQLITNRYDKIWQHAKNAFDGRVIFSPSEEEREIGIFFLTPYFTGPSTQQVLCLTHRLLRPESGTIPDLCEYDRVEKMAKKSLNKRFSLAYEEASLMMYQSGLPYNLTPESAGIPFIY